MRVIIQRVLSSSVKINNQVVGEINKGFNLLVGFTYGDNIEIIEKMINKILNIRIFEDEGNKMNKSIIDVDGDILSISQFTLYADPYNGRRPSFVSALKFEEASKLYDQFNNILEDKFGKQVQKGIFGADMIIDIKNDGPVTIILDSKYL